MQACLVRGVITGVLLCASTATFAADLTGGYRTSCAAVSQSNLINQSSEVIRQTVWSNLDNARAAMNEPAVLASTRPSFVWAMETRWACEAAAGYLATGHFDTESIQECDCFYQRHLSYR
jgi:hypothetical protein